MYEILFWLAVVSIFYAYAGYPLLLVLWSRLNPRRWTKVQTEDYPTVSILIPCYNEEAVIGEKLRNTLDLDYPSDKLEILVVSDGSTDQTVEIIRGFARDARIRLLEVHERKGKFNALNKGLAQANNEIMVFSDASILLRRNALIEIVRGFASADIGCISGEDHIPEVGGEGLYGQYELLLRNLESQVGSIVGASGSFYAQRRILCRPFQEGLAPDFLSVLNTVEQGYRAVTEPAACGDMRAVKAISDEFARKVRTLLRGMTTLMVKKQLLNPYKYPSFAFILISHKLFRWLVPMFMLIAFICNLTLIESGVYFAFFVVQLIFYLVAVLAWFRIGGVERWLAGKLSLYFCIVNLAILVAWYHFLVGRRQEMWEPSKRT